MSHLASLSVAPIAMSLSSMLFTRNYCHHHAHYSYKSNIIHHPCRNGDFYPATAALPLGHFTHVVRSSRFGTAIAGSRPIHSQCIAYAATPDKAQGECSWKNLITSSLQNALVVAALSLSFSGIGPAEARPEGVNRPELLPKEFTPVIDVAGFLSEGQETRIIEYIKRLEDDTGFKLRVLAQNYPNTPGLAVKDFWQVDDNTIVFVADPSMGNILNFNVGAAVDLNVPRSFWSRLAGQYGNIFYWREKGEDSSIEAAVSAIDSCLREPQGAYACSDVK